MALRSLLACACLAGVSGFMVQNRIIRRKDTSIQMSLWNKAAKSVPVVLLGVAFTCMSPVTEDAIAFSSAGVGPTKASSTVVLAAEDTNKGMSSVSDSKLKFGAASTGDKGARKTVTRGVNIENADFHSKDMSGVSFQQSLVRGTNFKDAKLVAAGFFDADLSNCILEGANLNQANLEMTNLSGANMKNAVVTEAYVSGATKMEPADIEGADFTDTFLRKDQVKYLCEIAKGTNPVTGVDTKDSLGCP
ncbi:unnamed protein product [Ascophyllum nodosum]